MAEFLSKARHHSAGTSKRKATNNQGSNHTFPATRKIILALQEALDLLRGTITNAAFPPNSKTDFSNLMGDK